MDLWSAVKIVGRRWYVALPTLALGAVAVVLVMGMLQTTYRASGSIILLPPSIPDGPDAEPIVNPYVRGDGLVFMVSALEEAAGDDRLAEDVENTGFDGEFTVVANPDGRPIMTVTTEATSEEEAITAVGTVTTFVQARLLELQRVAGAPTDQLITSQPLTLPKKAEPLTGSKVRAALALGVLVFAGAVGMAFAVDGIANSRAEGGARRGERRRARRAAAVEAAAEAESVAVVGAPATSGPVARKARAGEPEAATTSRPVPVEPVEEPRADAPVTTSPEAEPSLTPVATSEKQATPGKTVPNRTVPDRTAPAAAATGKTQRRLEMEARVSGAGASNAAAPSPKPAADPARRGDNGPKGNGSPNGVPGTDPNRRRKPNPQSTRG